MTNFRPKYKTIYLSENKGELNFDFYGILWIKDKFTKEFMRATEPIKMMQLTMGAFTKENKYFFIRENTIFVTTNTSNRILIKYAPDVPAKS